MLKNHNLLIDKNCPLCKTYGHCFTTLKIIDKETVTPYQEIELTEKHSIDMDRAKNEIALYDKESNSTVYGIDAMISIISNQKKWLNVILNFAPIYFLLNQLYKFISYNRKLIVPVNQTQTNERNCIPDVNLYYRWAYIILTALFTGLILNLYFDSVFKSFNLAKIWWLEYLICFGQVIWQGTIITFLYPDKRMDYLGNMSTVSTIGAILLIPMLFIMSQIGSSIISLLYFGLVVSFMLYEHIRRCSLLDLSIKMSMSWVIYRVVILTIFLLFNI